MDHMMVNSAVAFVFERLDQGDYKATLSGVGTTSELRFAGSHCLGGQRTSVGPCDTQVLIDTLNRMVVKGIEEAKRHQFPENRRHTQASESQRTERKHAL